MKKILTAFLLISILCVLFALLASPDALAGEISKPSSIDAYHYFDANDDYFDRHLRSLLKCGAAVALAVVGLKQEIDGGIPEEMKPWWDTEGFSAWHSAGWWAPKSNGRLSELQVGEMACFERAWADWLATDNPYALGDRPMMAKDAGRYMNLVSLTGKTFGPARQS